MTLWEIPEKVEEFDEDWGVATLAMVSWSCEAGLADFTRGSKSDHSFPYFPHFYPCNALSMARSEHHSFEPCGVWTDCGV